MLIPGVAMALEVRAGKHQGFGRLVFEWPEATNYTAEIDGTALTITFDRPIEADLARALSRLRGYLRASRLHSDGRGITLTLQKPLGLKHFTLTDSGRDRIVIDLIENWTAPPRPAPTVLPSGPAVRRLPSMARLGSEVFGPDHGGAERAGADHGAPKPPASLRDLFLRVLRDPGNIALNLRYAALAESRDDPGKAYSAYERVLALEPDNPDARAGVARLAESEQQVAATDTATTTGVASFGLQFDSNAKFLDIDTDGFEDGSGAVGLSLSDDRLLFGQAVRSRLDTYTDFHLRAEENDLEYFNLRTGPLWRLEDDSLLHIALKAELAGVHFDYLVASGGLRLEWKRPEKETLRVAAFEASYADYANQYERRNGPILRGEASLVWPLSDETADTLSLAPRYTWVGAEGAEERFHEFGGRVGYATRLAEDWFGLDAIDAQLDVAVRQRFYAGHETDIDSDRHDTFLRPSLSVVGRGLGADWLSLTVGYAFERNFSNDRDKSYAGHSATVNLNVEF